MRSTRPRQRGHPGARQRRPRRVAPADDPADVPDPARSPSARSSRRSCRSSSRSRRCSPRSGSSACTARLIDPVSAYASQLVVLIGLAVAVDYSLFMITRFRTERRHGRAKLAAIEVASATAGRAVFFSGLAVMFSIGGLFLLNDVLFRSMAVGTIAVVLDRGHRLADVPAGDAGHPRRRREPAPRPDLGRDRGPRAAASGRSSSGP